VGLEAVALGLEYARLFVLVSCLHPLTYFSSHSHFDAVYAYTICRSFKIK